MLRTIPQALSTATTITVNLNNQNPDQIKLSTTTITFAQQTTTQIITVSALDDAQAEMMETYPIDIKLPANTPAIITTKILSITVPSNDLPILTITPKQLTLTEGQTTQITITANPAVNESVVITLNDGGQDRITGIPSQITLPAGQTSTVFSITVTDDTTPSAKQTITITLNSVVGLAQIAEDKQTTITIPPELGGTVRLKIRVFLEGALP